MTCFNAIVYPSGVYAASRSCSTRSTSSSLLAASSPASAATPLPMTTAARRLPISAAICCAAASVSKLVLFHCASRCSVIRRRFIDVGPRQTGCEHRASCLTGYHFCHSERSEKSLFGFSLRKERVILRSAQNDKTIQCFLHS